jgi:hypothetical protein
MIAGSIYVEIVDCFAEVEEGLTLPHSDGLTQYELQLGFKRRILIAFA